MVASLKEMFETRSQIVIFGKYISKFNGSVNAILVLRFSFACLADVRLDFGACGFRRNCC